MLISRITITPTQSFGKRKGSYTDLVTAQKRIYELKNQIGKAEREEIQISKNKLKSLRRELDFHNMMIKRIANKVTDEYDPEFGSHDDCIDDNPYLEKDIFHKKEGE